MDCRKICILIRRIINHTCNQFYQIKNEKENVYHTCSNQIILIYILARCASPGGPETHLQINHNDSQMTDGQYQGYSFL